MNEPGPTAGFFVGPTAGCDAPDQYPVDLICGRSAKRRPGIQVQEIGGPLAATIVNATIAYTDALTATFANKVNQQDHAAAVKTLRSALGNRFPKAQETKLVRLLGAKDLAQYGGRFMRLDDAESLLAQLKEYAKWVETEMTR